MISRFIFIAAVFICHVSFGQNARIVKLPELERLMSDPSHDILIVNFWATWCAPCVKELPLFEKLDSERSDVKVTLVSLDLDLDPNPEKVYKFISRKKLQSEVLLLNESDPNAWIDRIDPKWNGALPATIILKPKTGKRIFIGRSVKEGELEEYISQIQ